MPLLLWLCYCCHCHVIVAAAAVIVSPPLLLPLLPCHRSCHCRSHHVMATIIAAAAAMPVSLLSLQPYCLCCHYCHCYGCGHGKVVHMVVGCMATWWVQVQGYGKIVRNCKAQGDMGAHQHCHILSSPHIIAINMLSWLVVGPWWALEGEGH